MGFFDKLFGREVDTTVTDFQARVDSGGAFRLVVQDVFSITGRGTVVTGTVEAGSIRVGDLVRITSPDGTVISATVTGVEMFRKQTTSAVVGDHVGLLVDGVARDQIAQGSTITTVV